MRGERNMRIRSEYNIDIEKVQSRFCRHIPIEHVDMIKSLIENGYGNMEIMHRFGFERKSDDSSLYKRIVVLRRRFNDYRKVNNHTDRNV